MNFKRFLLPALLLATLIILAGLLIPGGEKTLAVQSPPAQQQNPPAGKNRLAFETSPYLLQHAENPVDWYPWGADAFARAKAENKPIFLSVGYSTCYWCQVMERQSFADPAVATLLNQHFVSIKVDREERPDVDAVYMAAVLSMTGSGGWPMSVFLTPDLQPFHGGTYFPNAAFKQLLGRVHELWTARRPELLAAAEAVTKGLRSGHRQPTNVAAGLPPATLVDQAARRFAEVFDQTDGGFGRAPKFPRPAILELLLTDYRASGRAESLAMVRRTLDAMARGGMYDQVAGGFHRYSTDRKWLVPHFEKMLYDNAQLLHAYTRAYQLTGEADFRRIAEQIADYVKGEMTGPNGLFFSAQDSNIDGEEGRTYVWSQKNLEKVLSKEELALVRPVYGVDAEPNFEGSYILHWPRGFEETARREKLDRSGLFRKLDPIRAKLLAARHKLEQPRLDDKSVTAWNGLMIESLAYAGEVLKRPEYVRMAKAASDELLRTLRDRDGNLLHVARQGKAKLDAYLDDYAAAILGLVELGRVTGEGRWKAEAAGLADEMIAELWDPAGGFRYAPVGVEHLLIQPRDTFDGAFPTGNSLAARALVRLAAAGEPRFAPYAAGTLRAFGGQLEKEPRALPYMLWGLAEYRLSGLPEKVAMPNAEPALPKTSDRVRVEARLSPAVLAEGREAELEVTISMDEGWHIVANPTTIDSLIPTSLQAEIEGGELRVLPRYPAGRKIETPLGKIAIYEDGVTIPVRLVPLRRPKESRNPLVGLVKAQACNDSGRCLLPSTIQTDLPVALEPGRIDSL